MSKTRWTLVAYADDTQVYISAPVASSSTSSQRFTHWRLDEKQQTENECRQDTAGVARDTSAACQADHHWAPTDLCPRQTVVRSAHPRRQHQQPADHYVRSRRSPVMSISTTPATDGHQNFANFGGRDGRLQSLHELASGRLHYCNHMLYSATTLDLFLPTSGDRLSFGAMVERRDGPSWLRDDDDDERWRGKKWRAGEQKRQYIWNA